MIIVHQSSDRLSIIDILSLIYCTDPALGFANRRGGGSDRLKPRSRRRRGRNFAAPGPGGVNVAAAGAAATKWHHSAMRTMAALRY